MNANDLYKLGMDIQAMLCFINDQIIETEIKQLLSSLDEADKNSPYRKIIELQYKMEDTLNKGMIGYEQEISLYREQIIPHQTRLLDYVYRLALNEQIFVLGFTGIDDIHPVLIPSHRWRALKISIENDEASFNDKQYFALRFLKPTQLFGNELEELKTELAANNKNLELVIARDKENTQVGTEPELTKLEKQRNAIMDVILLKEFNPLAIPDGEKGTIKDICQADYPDLFDGTTSFDNAWKASGSLFRMANHASYAKRGTT